MGGFRVVYEYANRLTARGHTITVVHPRWLEHLPKQQFSLRGWVRERRDDAKALLRRPQIDWQAIDPRVQLLYVHGLQIHRIPEGDAIMATSWSTVRPVIECPPNRGEKFYFIQGEESYHAPKELVIKAWRAPVRKIVIAKWLVDFGREIGCDDLTYIPNAIAHERYKLTQPMTGRPKQVAMLFSSTLIKGSADGIEALRIVRQRHPSVRIVFFGVARRTSQVPEWAEYYRNPSQDFLINEIYNKSSIFLAPSWTEGFPLPPAEAAACGCAVVATDIGGFREYIHHGVTGLTSPAKEPAALAGKVCELLEDEPLRVRLATAGRDIVRRFDWDRSAELMERCIERTLQVASSS
jgi:glycosyltransferase involved in cell wall biosynthesis